MPYTLIILGVFVALAGIGSIAAGAPSWALGLGLGSALIQSGTVGLVGGFLLMGIGFVLRSLRDLSRRIDMLDGGAPARMAAPVPQQPAPRAPVKREPPPAPVAARREPAPFAPPREAEDAYTDEADDRGFPEPELPRPRPRAPAIDPRGGPRQNEDRRAERPRYAAERAPVDYEDELPPPSRNGGAASSATVVRSGIIGGMAYTLYTDGSIEAELPIGTVRFASIEELQDHVSQTGEDADVDFGGSGFAKN